MAAKVQVVFHSLYGHVWKLAEAIAEGARSTGAEVSVFQVAELLPADVIAKMGATEAKKAFAHVPLADPNKLPEADAIFLGTGTRYGHTSASMQAFLDATGGLWGKGALIGKVGSGFASTGSQHGGQETTLMSLSTFFFHQGMVISGVPYSAKEMLDISQVSGGTPYGATTIVGHNERQPSENELAIARFQGKHVAEIAAKLVK